MRVAAGGEPLVPGGAAQELARLLGARRRGAQGGAREPGLVGAQRHLGGGAGEVGGQHVGVVRVQHGVLEGAAQELVRVRHQVLIERIGLRDQRDHAVAGAPDAARALPGRDLAARVPDQDADVEASHVDAELERRGGDHAGELAAEQAPLDLAPLLGQEARAIGADARGEGGLGGGDPLVHQLGDAARLREGDRAQAGAHREPEQPSRDRVGGAARRVEQQHVALGARRAFGQHHGGVAPGEQGGQLARVGDRGRRAHQARPRAVERADALEAAQHLGDVRAEHAPVGVQLVHHHEGEPAKEALPAHVVGQETEVQHVRRRDQHMGRVAADALPRRGLRIAVVDGDRALGREAQRGRVGRELLGLVLLERLQRKQEERVGARVGARGLEGGQRVHQRFPARGRRREHDVAPARELRERAGLMRVERVDPTRAQQRLGALGQPAERRPPRRLRREPARVAKRARELPIRAHRVRECLDARGRALAHRAHAIPRSAARRARRQVASQRGAGGVRP